MNEEDKDNIQETPQKEKKSWKNGSERYQNYQILRDAGKSIKQAGEIVGYNKDYPYHVERKYQKYSMTHPKLVKKANRFLHYVIDSAQEGQEQYINPATTLTRDIYDRLEPKVNKIESDSRHTSIQITADATAWADKVLDMIAPKQITLTTEGKQ